MKRAYTKPWIYVENISLTQNIAESCGFGSEDGIWGEPLHGNPSNCAWQDPWETKIFLDINAACDVVNDGAFCYNAPSGALVVFGS